MALERTTSLSELAGYGFINLEPALKNLEELVALIGDRARPALAFVAKAQNPDQSLELLLRLSRNHTSQLKSFCAKASHLERLCLVLGASSALFEFLDRHVEHLSLLEGKPTLPTQEDHARELLAQAGSLAQIRIGYRKQLTKIASFDIEQLDPLAGVAKVAASLADLAGATLDAGLKLARQEISNPENSVSFPEIEVSATRVAVIGMGKCGARELNYISDVDVIFVAEPSGDIESSRAMEIATKLVTRMMRIMDEVATEPPLWQVDANLRPEGKSGALVRSLDSHQSYYERWAESWEFQALLKARPIAGDPALGADYIARIWPKVWESTVRENFVESVQKMRQRVTDHIPVSEVDAQIKLGPGGLRDIEFTVQLLQLVHGRSDQSIRVRDTLGALEALSNGSYIGRDDAERFSAHYRFLRLLEHRIQLSAMRRTHLMPTDEQARRSIARAVSLELTAEQLISRWEKVKLEVRDLHQQLFYRPLLSAVSGLSQEDLELTSAQAQDRLAAIGFGDTKGALAHISALTTGLSRRAAIQRQLLPVLLQWFAEGTDPDAALLAFRRLSEDLGDSHWYLRMLRDSSGAAKRMTQVFSTSRLATSLFEKMPEAAAWFDREDELEPDTLESLNAQFEAIVSRHEDAELAAASIRAIRRKETLRVAMGAALGIIDLERTSRGLTDLTESYLIAIQEIATKFLIEKQGPLCHELAIVAMGRFGGAELGFGSDADVMFVYRVLGEDVNKAQAEAEILVSEIRRLSSDQSLEFELDLDLRPEGKNGPIVRSIDSYSAYYQRWAGTWESQALLRARLISGEQAIASAVIELIDQYRYPEAIEQAAIVEIRRIKARVEVERLPQGADPKRHLKLGRGSISDVEWLVQLFQLKYASANPQIQTPHTLPALAQMEACGLINNSDARVLKEAWVLSSSIRSNAMLYLNKRTDVLPLDRQQLEGIARLNGYPRGGASSLEQDYLAATRRGRAVFEKLFFD
ncbi:MAG: bifunctional [glutamine synthetase] adenylyltransferase/[glutamine synthetase]-adenylyl-L-tyrosine phosphorylase [Micrococcales bacterium]|nr:bifunctional [glutamine synthetase] adenylyltransferase/[glutamine synthetase]-adenylyl-L-tyrosine phosphorylase [Micrococcales bacterium]